MSASGRNGGGDDGFISSGRCERCAGRSGDSIVTVIVIVLMTIGSMARRYGNGLGRDGGGSSGIGMLTAIVAIFLRPHAPVTPIACQATPVRTFT